MSTAGGDELLVRGAAVYLPGALAIALAWRARPGRRGWGAVLLATVWNLVALFVVNVLAVRIGWWRFDAAGALVAGIPADLWVGWAVLWGTVPVLTPRRFGRLVVVLLVAADLVLMPLAAPVVVLAPTWLVGEAVAVATCLLPGVALARWTAEGRRLRARVAMQMAAFTGLLFVVLPALVFTQSGDDWAPLFDRSRPQLVGAGLLAAPFAAVAVQGVLEFARHGGTPLPLDPPPELVRTGPYAYLANPMQAGATVLLAGWGVLLASPAVVLASAMAAVFSIGFAAWSEDRDLLAQFGDEWSSYRRAVRTWWPSWRPAVAVPAITYVASGCDPCREVGGFLAGRRLAGVELRPAETSPDPLVRITYEDDAGRASGLAAIGRTLERAHLGWAVASWIARLPGIQPILQLITDAVGGGPRPIPSAAAPAGSPVDPFDPVETGGRSWPAS